jgi:hypothetical protein
MSQFVADTKVLLGLALSVRPVSYEADGLMRLLWVKDKVMHSYYKNVLLSVPADLPDFMVEAIPFIKAVRAAKSKEMKFNMTEAGNLTISAGRLRTRMDLINEPVPEAPVVQSWSQVKEGLLSTMTSMSKLVPEAAPQAWATNLLFRKGYAYASNGVYLVRQQLSTSFDFECAMSRPLLEIMTKLKKEPLSIGYADNTLFFGLEGNVSISCPATVYQWPDVSKFFDAHYDMTPVTPEFKEVVEQLEAYNEGLAILRINAPDKAVVRFPSDALANQTVDVVFESTSFKRNLNLNLKSLNGFLKTANFIGFGNKLIVLSNEDRDIIISETH